MKRALIYISIGFISFCLGWFFNETWRFAEAMKNDMASDTLKFRLAIDKFENNNEGKTENIKIKDSLTGFCQIPEMNNPQKFPILTNKWFVDTLNSMPIAFYLNHPNIDKYLKLYSFTVDKSNGKSEFEMKVETLLNGLETEFEESPERRLNSKHNDLTLETKTNSTWNKTVTLKSKKTFINHYNQTVKQRLYLGFHDFKTVDKCDEAFEKVMDCLGTDCQKIDWGDEKTGLKTTPFIYLKTEKQIVFCKIYCEHKNDFWTTFKVQLETEFKTKKFKIITAECGGPLTFKQNND